MKLEPLPLGMSTDNLKAIIDQFRSLGAPIMIKQTSVEIMSPNGLIVFRAKKAGLHWQASAKPGLINASFKA